LKRLVVLVLLGDCTATVKRWYLENGLSLNADKSEAILPWNTNSAALVSYSYGHGDIAGTILPISKEIRSFGVIIDRHLTLLQVTLQHSSNPVTHIYGLWSTFVICCHSPLLKHRLAALFCQY